MSWERVIGQERVKKFFGASLERRRLAPAVLLSGSEGVGKYAVALELAKTVNCENPSNGACDSCRSCRLFDSLQHPNFSLVMPLPPGKNEVLGDPPLAKLSEDDLAQVREQLALKAANPYYPVAVPRATTIKINSIREIRRASSLAAFDGRGKKVYVILDADMMNDEGANALLKTLEEPLPDTMLVLTATNPDRLLRTIISRCQHVRFEQLPEDAIRSALISREHIAPGLAAVAARLGNGSYTRAWQFCTSGLFEKRKEAVEYLRTLLARTRREFLKEVERTASEYDRPGMAELFSLMQDWLREAMLAEQGIAGVVAEDEQDTFRKFVEYYRGSDYAAGIGALENAISLLDKNVYIPLIQLELAAQLRSLIRPAAGRRSSIPGTPKGSS